LDTGIKLTTIEINSLEVVSVHLPVATVRPVKTACAWLRIMFLWGKTVVKPGMCESLKMSQWKTGNESVQTEISTKINQKLEKNMSAYLAVTFVVW